MQNENYMLQAQKLNLQHLINNTHLNQNTLPLRESKKLNFDISDELASLRNEFRNFKNSIRTKISNDLSDSENYSQANSVEKPNSKANLTEDKSDPHSAYHTGNFENLYNTGSFSTGNKSATPPSVAKQEAILTVQEYETDYKKSPSISRQNTSIPDMSRFDEEISDYERSLYWNPETDNPQTTLLDVKSIFDGKPFIVMSKPNDINQKKDEDLSASISDASSFSNTKRKDVKNIFQKFEEENIKSRAQMNGLLEFKSEVSKLMKGISKSPSKSPNKSLETQMNIPRDPFERKKAKYREVEVNPVEPQHQEQSQNQPAPQERSPLQSLQENQQDPNALNDLFRKRICNNIGQNSSDELYLKKKMELENMNNRLLETDEPSNDDDYESNNEVPMFKKTLSVIFSTDESVESSNISRHCSRKSLMDKFDDYIPPERSAVRKKGSLQDGSDFDCPDFKENLSQKAPSREPSLKEFEKPEKWASSLNSNVSSKNGDDDNVLSLVQLIMFQNRGNKELEDRLNRLIDVYSSHAEKQESKINELKQKNEKLTQANELLIKTLKTCEKEVDNLAQTNSNLHKNLVYFQNELGKRDNSEEIKKLAQSQREQLRQQRQEIDKKSSEVEDYQRKLTVSEAKVLGLTAYTKSCEESICAINVTLKKLIQKSNMKHATPALYKVLSSIVDETSKFVDKLDTSCEADISKQPMNSKPSSYFESGSDSSMSFERENYNPKRPSPRVSPTKILQEHKRTNNNILQNSSPLSSNTLKSNSSAVSIVKSYENSDKKETRSTSAMAKRGRDKDKENLKENLTSSTSNKSSRKEKSAPNLRSTSPNFSQPTTVATSRTNSDIDDKIKDNLRKRLMSNLKTGQRK